MRDPNLQHQTILDFNNDGQVIVTCNCRQRAGVGPIGVVVDYPDTKALYNDPERHVEPFGEEWMLNGQRGKGV